MESYPDPQVSSSDRGEPFYSNPPTTMAHIQDESMIALGQSMGPVMHGQNELQGQQDSRSHEQLNHNFHNATSIPNHLSTPNMQAGNVSLGQIPIHYNSPNGGSSARKRSKVSRACDECRRKKIKCDAQTEEGSCSNCRRSTVECQFSRIPQKRGPSKGYINALEKRVRALEHTNQDAMFENALSGGPNLEDVLSSAREEYGGRKRSFSNANSNNDLALALQQQQTRTLAPGSPWNTLQQTFPANQSLRQSPQQQGNHLIGNEDNNFARPNYNIQDVFPLHQDSDSSRLNHEYNQNNLNNNTDALNNSVPSAFEERALDSYYQCIHPTLPILSDNRSVVSSSLNSCPSTVAEAFQGALNAAVCSVAAPDLSQSDPTQSQIAADLLNRCDIGEPLRSLSVRLVHLQALMFMSIESQSRTHNPAVRQVGGSLSKWLSSAISTAFDMQLHSISPIETTEVDNESALARRIWLSLCILDRISAHSTGGVVRITEDHFNIHAQDLSIVGEPLFNLARLTSVLGLMAQTNVHEQTTTGKDAPFSYGFFPKRLLDSWELDHRSMNSSVVHTLYWHTKLLVALGIKTTPPAELQMAAIKMVEFFAHDGNLASPILIYITGLLVLVLIELLRYDSTKLDAQRALKLLREKSYIPRGWEASIRKLTDEILAPDGVDDNETSGSQNLRRLANVAIAETERVRDGERSENDAARRAESGKQWSYNDFKDLRRMIRSGFMNVFNPSR